MPVFADGSTTNIPAHREEAMPCEAAMADILNDPDVCWVSLLSSAGCTTLIVDCVLGSDNPCIAISPESGKYPSVMVWTNGLFRLFPMHFLWLAISRLNNCTVQYSTI